jgi:WD40 repeat protein
VLCFEDGGVSIFNLESALANPSGPTNELKLVCSGRKYCEAITSIGTSLALNSYTGQWKEKLITAYLNDKYSLVVWQLDNLKPIKELLGHTNIVSSIITLRDSIIASTSLDSKIIFWDVEKNSVYLSIEGHKSGILCSAYNQEKEILYTGGLDGTICAWGLTIERDSLGCVPLLKINSINSINSVIVLPMDRILCLENSSVR